jgi:RHS repeat-associated protein
LLTNENGEQYIAQIDNLNYDYQQGAGNEAVHHNRLLGVSDGASATEGFTNGTSSYSYDAIGNLIEDSGEDISNINWTVYGKVERVRKEDGTIVSYRYDAAGNRVRKQINESNGTKKNTFYIKDASGNTIATYQNSKESGQQNFMSQPTSYYLFGSSRLGKFEQVQTEPDSYFARRLGSRSYELSNHLGNVLATVSDKKLDNGSGGFTTDVTTTSDYYPFGLTMNGRSWQSENYRFGFNGKENDSSWGSNNIQDYGFRLYSPAEARFKSVDPLTSNYAMLTPYQFAGNTPLWAIDLDGLEAYFIHGTGMTNRYFQYNSVLTNEIVRIFQHTKEPIYFEWSGKNNKEGRAYGSMDLAVQMINNYTPGEEITLVGHSHGGNVAKEAVNIALAMANEMELELEADEINIVMLNSPERDDYLVNEDALLDGLEYYKIINSETDFVKLAGSLHVDGKFPYLHLSTSGADQGANVIKYEDRLEGFYGFGGHLGDRRVNYEQWLPQLEEAVLNNDRNRKLQDSNENIQYRFPSN